MDVESKLGQSLDDLIKSQKTANKKKTGAAKGKKTVSKGVKKTPVKKGKVAVKTKTPVSGGVKKGARPAASGGKNRRISTGARGKSNGGPVVVMRGGKGIGHGLGPKEGLTRRQNNPPRVSGGTGESISSRFDKINRRAGGRGGRRPQGGSRPRNSYGVVMPL